jgi:hypothetical protein
MTRLGLVAWARSKSYGFEYTRESSFRRVESYVSQTVFKSSRCGFWYLINAQIGHRYLDGSEEHTSQGPGIFWLDKSGRYDLMPVRHIHPASWSAAWVDLEGL